MEPIKPQPSVGVTQVDARIMANRFNGFLLLAASVNCCKRLNAIRADAWSDFTAGNDDFVVPTHRAGGDNSYRHLTGNQPSITRDLVFQHIAWEEGTLSDIERNMAARSAAEDQHM